MVLLIVDTQKAITNSGVYNFEQFEANIAKLIDTARKSKVEVIFVRHDDGAGNSLTKGSDGFEIYGKFQPAENERIFDKTVNSAFRNTGLAEYLKEKGENTVIIVGLQTEYCIDATIKAGFERGFKIIVPANCNSTFDNEFMSAEQTYNYYNNFIWNKRYADCISFEKTVEVLQAVIK